jgi:hypothetical protein
LKNLRGWLSTGCMASNPRFPYNTGIILCGAVPYADARRTLVITGTPRGGTTAIAECIATLGVPIGPLPPPPEQFNYEDPAFMRILQMMTPQEVNLEELRDLVRRRDEAHATWGFKLPMALNSLAVLERELRNPIFVFRDVVAVSSREAIANGDDAMSAMARALDWQRRMLDFIASAASPCLLISYEKALQFPDLLPRVLARWADLSCGESLLNNASAKIAANSDDYLRGVRLQREQLGIPAPPKA